IVKSCNHPIFNHILIFSSKLSLRILLISILVVRT
ncbi:hypothetical protein PanWU01x14_186400, partial [Parasponia andersonii]